MLKKCLLSLLLCAALVFGLCLPAAAEEDTSGDVGTTLHWSFEESSGTLTITCTADEDVPMPSFTGSPNIAWKSHQEKITSVTFLSNGGGRFTSIGNLVFYDCKNLRSITLPESVTSIGGFAFDGCTNLRSITLPEGVTSIGGLAFSGCTSLKEITLPEGVTSIGISAFSNCTSLGSITLPEGVTSIGRDAFSGCTSLGSITLPKSVTSIGERAFSKCTNLTSVTFTKTSPPTWDGDGVFDGCNNLKEIRVPPEGEPGYRVALENAGLDMNNVTMKGAYPVTVTAGEGGTASASPDFAAAGDTITLTATPDSDWQFKAWQVVPDSVSVSGNSFIMPAGRVDVTAVFEKKQSGGGGGGGYIPPTPPTPPTYPPAVEQPDEGGSVGVSPSRPQQGDTVTVTPKPDAGYEVGEITVTDQSGKPVEVTKKPDGTYTFKQPGGRVTIEILYNWINPFTDLDETAWYYEAVKFVQENGLMNGYGDGRFAPHNDLSRSQLAQILFNKEGRPAAGTGEGFADTDSGAWYAGAVAWAAKNGIISGYGNGAFGPNDPITREQLAVMLWRYSGRPTVGRDAEFADMDAVSSYALEAVDWARANGIVQGKEGNRFDPQGTATRAEVAQMLKNFIGNPKAFHGGKTAFGASHPG